MTIHIDDMESGWAGDGNRSGSRGKRKEPLEYQATFLIAFVAFLAAALLGRLMPWRWQVFGGPGVGGKRVFEEARDLTTGTVPYAFMR